MPSSTPTPTPIIWSGAHEFNYSRLPIAPLGICYHIMEGYLGRAHANPRLRSGTAATFWSPSHGASTFFGVGRDGTIHQYVSLRHRAHAQGLPAGFRTPWAPPAPTAVLPTPELSSPNACLYSIEHEGFFGPEPWPDAQIEASAQLSANLFLHMQRVWEAPKEHGLDAIFTDAVNRPPWRHMVPKPSLKTMPMHSEVYPKKPNCPGPGFVARRLKHLELTSEYLAQLAAGKLVPLRFVGGLGDQNMVPSSTMAPPVGMKPRQHSSSD